MESRKQIPAVFNPQPRNTQNRQLVDIATAERRKPDNVQLKEESKHKAVINILSKFTCKTRLDRIHSGIFASFFTMWLTSVLRLVLGVWSIVNSNQAMVLAGSEQMYWSGLTEVINGILYQLICFLTLRSALTTLEQGSLTSAGVKAASVGFSILLVLDVVAIIYIKDVHDDAFQSKIRSGMFKTLQKKYGIDYDVTLSWDDLQTNKGCCGANSHSDWFNSRWALPIETTEGEGALPTSCVLEPTGGPCEALGGASVVSQPNYVVTSDVTRVEMCDSAELVYIHSDTCGEIFSSTLVKDMETVLLCTIGLLVVTLVMSISMFALGRLLPRHQRVTSAYGPEFMAQDE